MAARKKTAPKKKTSASSAATKKSRSNVAGTELDKRKKYTGAKHTSSKQVAKTVQELIESGHTLPKHKGQVRYSREIGAEICIRIASGESLNRICRDEHMPAKGSVLRWCLFADDSSVHKDKKLREELCAFRDHYDHARIIQAENFLDESVDVADDAINDYMEKEAKNGDVFQAPNPEIVLRSKLRVETRKWMAEVYLPKVQALRKTQLDLRSKQPIVLQFDKQDEEA